MRDFRQPLLPTALIVLIAASALARPALAGVIENIDPFLADHCYDCHDDTVSKGDLDLTAVAWEPWRAENSAIWARVVERVESGEMPPKKKPRPEEEAAGKFVHHIEVPLLHALHQRNNKLGRVPFRRLTRQQYEYSLYDLLGIDFPVSEILPEEAESHGFETVSDGQQFSHFHLARYLGAADLAIETAFSRLVEGDVEYRNEVSAKQLTKNYKRGNYRGPEFIDGRSVAWNLNNQFYGRMEGTKVPAEGFYRITVQGVHAINPDGQSVWGVLRRGYGHSNAPSVFPVGLVEAASDEQDFVFESWMEEDDQLILKVDGDLNTLKPPPHNGSGGGVAYSDDRDRVKEGFSGIANRGIIVERIYPNASQEQLRRLVLFDMTFEKWEELAGKNDERMKQLDRIVGNFAVRAFRDVLSWEVIAPYRRVAHDEYKRTKGDLVASLSAAYRTILCSPRFLGFPEEPGTLSGEAVASRLSYLLWGSMPDWTMVKKAESGDLLKPDVLHSEIDRLLDHPRSERFIDSFCDQWLDLEEIDFTSPDRRLFPNFDDTVKESMLLETRAFVRELFMENRPVTSIVLSDYGFFNERLARFYGSEGVEVKPGSGLQKVVLQPGTRSGLASQGAILKVTADGTVTSPIVRGVWINERLLGLHTPPPPPGIAAVEPDIRGAVSIRDQLDKHRSDESCASCHAKIDPAGFALENFDPTGRWREFYGKPGKSAKVDPTGVTPEGVPFNGYGSWREHYAGKPEILARNLASQLITFGTGAAPGFADRKALDEIVESVKGGGYCARDLLHAVIASDIFLSK